MLKGKEEALGGGVRFQGPEPGVIVVPQAARRREQATAVIDGDGDGERRVLRRGGACTGDPVGEVAEGAEHARS